MIKNRLLQRDLQTFISNLKAPQLKKMLTFYEESHSKLTCKTFSKENSKCYECQLISQSHFGKGFGRNEEEALSNASKQFFSNMISTTQGTDIVRNALKFKEGITETQPQTKNKREKENQTMILDDCSIIGSGEGHCNCIEGEVNRQNERKIKHLEARISLLTEENAMLKKLLLQDYNKENHSSFINGSNSSL